MSAAPGGLHGFVAGLVRGHRLRRSRKRRPVFCTVATESFLPWAQVLFEAVGRHHPGSARALVYVRAEGEAHRAPVIEGVSVIVIEDLVDAALETDLRRRYGMAELCFALKPRLLRHCLDHHGERVIYLDSDIDLQAPLQESLIALEGASVVLTPHLDAPMPRDGMLPSEVTILRAGSCNAGFVAVAESPETRAFLSWWGERAALWGFVAPEAGYQGDQKWLDLAPALFPCVTLLRDPGSNVGTWNLHSRTVARGKSGYVANGAPLAFFHFSGFDPANPARLSKYQNRHHLEHQPALAALAADYARRLLEARARAATLAWRVDRPAEAAQALGTFAEGPMPQQAYRAAFDVETPAGTHAAGEEIVARVRLTNASPHPWPVAASADGRGGLALSWHTRDWDGTVLRWENRRYPLPRDLAPGESVDLMVGLRAPDAPGRYQVQLDLVHEGITWFSTRGSAVATFPIYVGYFEAPA